MGDVSRIAEILGGEAALGTQVRARHSVEALTRYGVPMAAAFAVADRFQLGPSELVSIIGDRHDKIVFAVLGGHIGRPGPAEKLSPDESAHLIAATTVLAHAQRVFESDGEIARWLLTPQPVLGGRRPIDLLGDAESRQVVDDVLTRIEHGVFA
jgi:putative toxin-antitoxin system antitoxin component (TIGR02293 family)